MNKFLPVDNELTSKKTEWWTTTMSGVKISLIVKKKTRPDEGHILIQQHYLPVSSV
jgi:hypothetical protein